MGILINDTITLSNGLQANNTYGSLYATDIHITREGFEDNQTEHILNIIARCSIWISRAYREQNRPALKSNIINITVPLDTFLSSNLFTLLYDAWKTQFSSTTDVF